MSLFDSALSELKGRRLAFWGRSRSEITWLLRASPRTTKPLSTENAFQLANKLGVSPDVGARLWSDSFTRIDFVTLNRLCNILKGQPAQLIKFTPDTE